MRSIRRMLQREWLSCLSVASVAAVDAVLAVIFVYQNEFAPADVLGVTTMIQYLLDVQIGYQYLMVNIPLLLFAYYKLNKSYAVKNAIYVVFFSAVSILFQTFIAHFDLHSIEYVADSSEALFLVAIGYGAFEGVAYAMAVVLGGATGGTDIVAAGVNRYKPRFHIVWILFSLKVVIAGASYFVYGKRLLPVIASIVCSFAGSVVGDTVLKGRETALKFEVITEEPEAVAREVMDTLGRGCTCVRSTGMYQNTQNCVLICVVNKRQRYDFEQIIAGHPNTFAYCCQVKCIYGDFDR